MKKIIFTNADGGLSIVHPVEGFRLASSVVLSDGSKLSSEAPKSVDQFVRGWPVAGAVAQWVETEDAFVVRVVNKDVPPGAANVQIVDVSQLPTDRAMRAAWRYTPENGVHVDPVMAQGITKAALTAAVQGYLDGKARELGYDSVFTACTYADEPLVPKFQAEGLAFRGWRSKVWASCESIMQSILDGARGVPTPAELIAELPAFVAP